MMSLQASAYVDPGEVKQMMDQFVNQKIPAEKVTLAGLWVPLRVVMRFRDDFMPDYNRKEQAKKNSMEHLLELKSLHGVSDTIIAPNGAPAITLKQLRWVIDNFQTHIDAMEAALGPKGTASNGPLIRKIKDAESKQRALKHMQIYFNRYESQSRGYRLVNDGKSDNLRIGPEVWKYNPAMKTVFMERAIGAGANRRELYRLLFGVETTPAKAKPTPTTPAPTPAPATPSGPPGPIGAAPAAPGVGAPAAPGLGAPAAPGLGSGSRGGALPGP